MESRNRETKEANTKYGFTSIEEDTLVDLFPGSSTWALEKKIAVMLDIYAGYYGYSRMEAEVERWSEKLIDYCVSNKKPFPVTKENNPTLQAAKFGVDVLQKRAEERANLQKGVNSLLRDEMQRLSQFNSRYPGDRTNWTRVDGENKNTEEIEALQKNLRITDGERFTLQTKASSQQEKIDFLARQVKKLEQVAKERNLLIDGLKDENGQLESENNKLKEWIKISAHRPRTLNFFQPSDVLMTLSNTSKMSFKERVDQLEKIFGKLEVPQNFNCPISHEIMNNPVFNHQGITFDEKEIKDWLKNKTTCPMTGQDMQAAELKPNFAVKGIIEDFLCKKEMKAKKMIEAAKTLAQIKQSKFEGSGGNNNSSRPGMRI